jgi:hypothetical protein
VIKEGWQFKGFQATIWDKTPKCRVYVLEVVDAGLKGWSAQPSEAHTLAKIAFFVCVSALAISCMH